MINLDPTIGAEIKKTRPAIIVSDDALGKLPLKIIVPITDWKDTYQVAPWMTKVEPNGLNGLAKVSSADAFQIRSVSNERFVKRLGVVSEELMNKIKAGLVKVLSIDSDAV